jgi:uncharacterized membrane protein
MSSSWLAFLLICGVLIAGFFFLFLPTQRSRTKANRSTERHPTSPIFRDDDHYWVGGFFYNNPDDPEMFVPKRYGFGWTVNFGHPWGKAFLIGTLLLILLFGVLFPMLFSGTTPTGCHTFGCHP